MSTAESSSDNEISPDDVRLDLENIHCANGAAIAAAIARHDPGPDSIRARQFIELSGFLCETALPRIKNTVESIDKLASRVPSTPILSYDSPLPMIFTQSADSPPFQNPKEG
uniref:Uncharacterized protein n=1 Tax=Spongospora subterranea TaxID=70186 RepID=A0A0H5QHZ9_9EUKA|eukprot:CRZ01680.1 hypothetical protein [Spongospora subterranea]